MNDQERLTFELERFGHFTVEEGDRWTQAEIDAEWSRLHPPSSSPRSLAFVLNWDFKPASAPEPEPKQEEEVDEQDLCLPFVYKPDPNNTIDWDAIRAQPRSSRVEDSPAYKAAVINIKKRKSEEDLEDDKEAIKKKYEALQGKYFTFFQFIQFSLIKFFFIFHRFLNKQTPQLAPERVMLTMPCL